MQCRKEIVMSESNKIDEIMISAFVDNQIDADNRAAIIKAMDNDDELREQVYQIRKAKDLMKIAYGDSKPSDNCGKTFPTQKFSSPQNLQCMKRVAAAFSAIVIGLSSGYAGYNYGNNAESNTNLAELSQKNEQRIILHIDESDPILFESTLVYAEEFLLHNMNNKGVQIEVVANAGGIDLLREDFPLSKQVARMMDEHDNVTFIACTNAINRLRSQGMESATIKNVETETAALTHIIDRLNTGWTYLKADSKTLKAKTDSLLM